MMRGKKLTYHFPFLNKKSALAHTLRIERGERITIKLLP